MPITKTAPTATTNLTRAQVEAALDQVGTCVQEIEEQLNELAANPSAAARITAKLRTELRALTLAHVRACKAVESL